jgi:hypothetical protein
MYRWIKQQLHFKKTEGIEPQFVKDAVSRKEINDRTQKWSRLLTGSG